jgi:hypothetical protein
MVRMTSTHSRSLLLPPEYRPQTAANNAINRFPIFQSRVQRLIDKDVKDLLIHNQPWFAPGKAYTPIQCIHRPDLIAKKK